MHDCRECVDFDTFQKDLSVGTVDVIYEMYNEYHAHFEGILNKYPDWKTDISRLGGYCPEKFNKEKIEFIKTIWNHDKTNRKRFYDMLINESAVNIIVLKNRWQVNQFCGEFEHNCPDCDFIYYFCINFI